MVVVKIKGGLGNQMFQYAAGKALAYVHNVDLMLDLTWFKTIPSKSTPRTFQLYHYPIEAHISNSSDEINFKKFHSKLWRKISFVEKKWKYHKEKSFSFDADFFKYPKNSYLDGYWQSNLYFKNISHQILSQFQPITPADYQNMYLLEKIKQSNSVAIHIRRGDYITNPSTKNIHGICSLDYYKKAINYISEHVDNPHFYIFSDDLVWAKENLHLHNPVIYVDHNFGENQAFNDLRLMAACSHQIIANSSFSWWSAWLNENNKKIVLAPSKWFINKTDTSTLIPSDWITI